MSEYQVCMTAAMKGFPKGLTRGERGRLFCIEAKICSGKFTDRKEAEQDCINNPPAPKAEKTSRGGRKIDSGAIARCLLPKLSDGVTVGQLTTWIVECATESGINTKKVESKNAFMKKCVGELTETLEQEKGRKVRMSDTGSFAKTCYAKWKEDNPSPVKVPEVKPEPETAEITNG